MVTMAGPDAAEAPALSVRVLLPVVAVWLNEPVTPAGSPETLSETVPLKLF